MHQMFSYFVFVTCAWLSCFTLHSFPLHFLSCFLYSLKKHTNKKNKKKQKTLVCTVSSFVCMELSFIFPVRLVHFVFDFFTQKYLYTLFAHCLSSVSIGLVKVQCPGFLSTFKIFPAYVHLHCFVWRANLSTLLWPISKGD